MTSNASRSQPTDAATSARLAAGGASVQNDNTRGELYHTPSNRPDGEALSFWLARLQAVGLRVIGDRPLEEFFDALVQFVGLCFGRRKRLAQLFE
jgi:hypothetical protein